MIYQLHEFQKTVMAPTVLLADTVKFLFTSPFSPLAYTAVSRTIAANSEVFVRLMRRYPKPKWRIDDTMIDGERVAVTREVAVDKPFCQLVHFRKDIAVEQPKLLIVAPLSGHFATLLRDTVRTALPDHDVWVTDWVDARMVPLSKGPVPPRRLRGLRQGVHPPPVAGSQRDVGVPADRAGAGSRVADGCGERPGGAEGR